MPSGLLASINIRVGDHITAGPFNVDTIYATVVAGVVVLGLGFYVRRKVTSGVPSRAQMLWEMVVGWASDQVESALGPEYRRVVPLAVSIFLVILIASWVEVLPGFFHNTDFAPSPSADVNFCYALGLLVWVLSNVAGIRAKGFRKAVTDFFDPIHFVEHITRPITLALRLFGNIFAGGIMIALLLALPIYFAPATVAFTVVWKLFDMGIGVIQAFIFALLTILYYQFSTEEAH